MDSKGVINLAYADGSIKKGMGHLFRMMRTLNALKLNSSFLFIAKNEFQSNFYTKNKLTFISRAELKKVKKCKLLLIDSKSDESSLISEIKNKTESIISVDCLKCWVKKSDVILMPSFFIDKKNLNKKCLRGSKILFGKEYVSIEESRKHVKGIKLLITFGGTDPNDLSSKFLSKLPKSYLNKSTFVIVGPGFKNVSELKDNFPDVKFVEGLSNTADYVKSASKIVTALGTTLQECERFSKKTGVIFNYTHDENDFSLIKEFTSKKSNWFKFGHYKDMSSEKIIKFLNSVPSCESNVSTDWGKNLNFLIDYIK